MEKMNFSIKINAPREKVWNVMLGDATYRQWTAEFAPGSYAETDWQKGSKALFLSSSGDGMVSTIAENRPHEYLSIRHLGMVKDGVEDTTSDEVKGWAGAMENYTFKDAGEGTELIVEMDSDENYVDYFQKTWPKALNKLKKISEK